MHGLKLHIKERISLQKVLSGICGNLAAGWLGLILITPGIDNLNTAITWISLIKSLEFGILFLLISWYFERQTI